MMIIVNGNKLKACIICQSTSLHAYEDRMLVKTKVMQ